MKGMNDLNVIWLLFNKIKEDEAPPLIITLLSLYYERNSISRRLRYPPLSHHQGREQAVTAYI